jgi:hypothetical protein
MALTQEERKIVEFGKKQGKTQEQVLGALAMYRQSQSVPAKKEGGVIARTLKDAPSDLKEGFLGVGEQLNKAGEGIFQDATNKDLSFGEKLRGMGSKLFRGIMGAGGEVVTTGAKVFATPELEQATTEKIGQVAESVISQPVVQDIITKYQGLDEDTKRELQNALGFAEGLTGLVGGNVAVQSGKQAIQKGVPVVKAGIETASDMTGQVSRKTASLLQKTPEIVVPKKAPIEATKEVLQGKTKDLKPAIESFRNIELEGVKTFEELKEKMRNTIADLSEKVDTALAQDPTPIPLAQLTTTATSKGGQTVATNYVQTAIQNLNELYQKTGDALKKAEIDELLAKAQTEGLTRLEVNDLSRLYNQEFGSKAFSKMGDPLTSVNAQFYENTRKGLKDVARKGLGGKEALESDKIISSLYNTEKLVEKNVEAVNRLRQKIANRGLFEKTGHFISKYADILTGGTIRGIVGGLLPRGAGYKTLNALDLEERLADNLKIIQKALESNKDADITELLKKLEIK